MLSRWQEALDRDGPQLTDGDPSTEDGVQRRDHPEIADPGRQGGDPLHVAGRGRGNGDDHLIHLSLRHQPREDGGRPEDGSTQEGGVLLFGIVVHEAEQINLPAMRRPQVFRQGHSRPARTDDHHAFRRRGASRKVEGALTNEATCQPR